MCGMNHGLTAWETPYGVTTNGRSVAHPLEHDFLGDICGVVGHTFEMPGDEKGGWKGGWGQALRFFFT